MQLTSNTSNTKPNFFLPTMLCVCYLCTQKGCLGHGRLWNEQYWCCVWRVGCVGGGCNFVEGGGRGGERQKVEVCVLLV